jgi:hypothetical protein
MVMWTWMYVTRLPAIRRARMKLDPAAPRGEQMSTLPAEVRWKADNYNHLMEQPTIFYAMVFTVVLAGHSDQIHIYLAWAYVALRVVHSLIQNTVNIVAIRFAVFTLSTLALAAMAVREVIALL